MKKLFAYYIPWFHFFVLLAAGIMFADIIAQFKFVPFGMLLAIAELAFAAILFFYKKDGIKKIIPVLLIVCGALFLFNRLFIFRRPISISSFNLTAVGAIIFSISSFNLTAVGAIICGITTLAYLNKPDGEKKTSYPAGLKVLYYLFAAESFIVYAVLILIQTNNDDYTIVHLLIPYGLSVFALAYAYSNLPDGLKRNCDHIMPAFAVVIGFVIAVVLPIMFRNTENKWLYPALGFFVILIIAAFFNKKTNKLAAQQIAEDAAVKREKQRVELVKQVEAHEFEFPQADFYKECQTAGIKDVSTSFAKEKAALVMKSMFEKMGVPGSVIGSYTDDVVKYYNDGMAEFIEKTRIENTTPKDGTILNKEDRDAFHDQQVLAAITGSGIEKRIAFCNLYKYNYKSLTEEQQSIAQRLSNPAQLSLEKKKSWAVAGGIAEGIAGPAAGLGAALHTMQKNAEIDKRNAATAQFNAQLALQSEQVAQQTRKIAARYSSIAKEYADMAEEAKTKVVVKDVSTDELFNALAISEKTKIINDTENGSYVKSNLTIRNNYHPNIDGAGQMVTDGYLSVRFMCDEDLEIGAIDRIPLPLEGLECGDEVELEVFLNKYLTGTHKNCHAVVAPIDLWLMES